MLEPVCVKDARETKLKDSSLQEKMTTFWRAGKPEEARRLIMAAFARDQENVSNHPRETFREILPRDVG